MSHGIANRDREDDRAEATAKLTRRPGAGRPAADPEHPRTHTLQVRVSGADLDALEMLRDDQSLSGYAYKLMREGLTDELGRAHR